MISISRTIPTDGVDNVVILTNADFRDNTARMNRSKTLDGGVYINYSGVSDGDRTITLNEKLTLAQADILWDMFNDGVQVWVSIQDGFFTAAIRSCTTNNGQTRAAIYLENREA